MFRATAKHTHINLIRMECRPVVSTKRAGQTSPSGGGENEVRSEGLIRNSMRGTLLWCLHLEYAYGYVGHPLWSVAEGW